ncbi:MAG TPA: PatB family C-S lyase [Fibrobacteria bacterium]|nr:PatB family C-S lyase [Fibrobacteria bacterium]
MYFSPMDPFEEEFDRPLPRRGTDCAKWDEADRLFGAHDVLPLWVADMDFRAPPEVMEAIVQTARHGAYGYPAFHLDSVSEALCDWLVGRQGWAAEPSWVIHVPGVVPALSVALEAFSAPGDRIVVQTPVYYPFLSLAREGGRACVESPLEATDVRWSFDADRLDRDLRGAKILMLCHPHNPVGRCWSRQELTHILESCRRHDVMVFSDEIHGDLVQPPHRHLPAASLGILPPHRIATFTAPSKTFNLAGLNQAAVLLEREEDRRAFERVLHRRHIPATNVVGLAAMRAAYRHGGPWLDALLPYLAANARLVEDFCRSTLGLSAPCPEATYLAWLDCRGWGMDDRTLEEFFSKRARVGLNRGTMFGAPGTGHMRLNLATQRSTLREALERISRARAELESA